MTEISISDDVKLSALKYVEVARDYEFSCGQKLIITLQMPEGVDFHSQISTNNNCPKCNAPVVIGMGHHYIEGNKLLTKCDDWKTFKKLM